ncbi:ABC transporter permease [Sphingobacterium alkalisoli]|uniref:ABC transporter permease n=1 Tax=Sphingobacterium alkalisoli TaxID=1874115 RepID=A0A4U0H5E7_9SPHI|nr:ABC transporter permease [Sphingobacterium alkalisoli]TJY65532.1 ABC transporter permease [Sphingobacterium alkalisoli]GGH19885.1 ABC transporter permease [Sphingobacterium alkalisoli]
MHKIRLIIQREYITRVKKRSFLLTTFLVPLFFIGMYIGVIFLTKKSFDDTHAIVYVFDQEGTIAPGLVNTKNLTYTHSNRALQHQIDSLKGSENNTNILVIPSDFFKTRKVELLSSGKPNVVTQKEVESQLGELVRNHAYQKLGINTDSIKNIKSSISINAKEITTDGETRDSNTEIAMGIALALSILVYISLFLYGSQVMRGIIEEKSSRIIEVIISSVKPFQLMMGKIIGIGMVGLTQFVLWIFLSLILAGVASTFLVSKEDLMSQMTQKGIQNESLSQVTSSSSQMELYSTLQSINFSELIICFFVFFIGGYLIYSALFAAVGSAVDSETEASQFTMPITMPLLLTYALSFGVLINDPHGTISMWLSFIPFTSPIAMLVRVPFGVPVWQLVVSALLLIGGFVLTTWFASRIYRVGILMHGKKASYKELLKWFRYKN